MLESRTIDKINKRDIEEQIKLCMIIINDNDDREEKDKTTNYLIDLQIEYKRRFNCYYLFKAQKPQSTLAL